MPPRRRIWDDAIISENTATDTQDSTDLLPSFQEGETKGFTLVRTIIGINIAPAALVDASVDRQKVSIGIGVFSREMIDIVDFPEPGVSNNIPLTGWIWRSQYIVSENAAVQTLRIDIDLRAQRKVMYGVPFLIIDSTVQSGSSFAVLTTGIIRSLYLLP